MKYVNRKGVDLSVFSLGTVQLGMDYGFGEFNTKPKKEYAFDIHEGAVVCSLNEEILPFLAEISQSASIVTGKEIWFHFSP